MTKKDKNNVLELIKIVRIQEDQLTQQQAYQELFENELEKTRNQMLLGLANTMISKKILLVPPTLYHVQHP